MKSRCERKPIINWQHIFLLTDDTVLLSSTRPIILGNLRISKEFCVEYGMRINAENTKLFVINGWPDEADLLLVDRLVMQNCTCYTYL